MANTQFKAEISTSKSSYGPKENVELSFKLTNLNKEDLYVLKWQTPLEGFRNNYLDVQHDGESVQYKGILVKRGNPSAESYILVQAESTAEASVVLNEGYDISQPGNYRIRLDTALMDVRQKSEGEELQPGKFSEGLNRVQLSADPVTFVVER